jgi:hypothetical protein
MNAAQAKRLLKYTIVMWDKNPKDLGTVVAVGTLSFMVNWTHPEGKERLIRNNKAGKVSVL